MEHIHGVDVSWMSHGSHKDKKPAPRRRNTLPSQPSTPPMATSPPSTPRAASPQPASVSDSAASTANATPSPPSSPVPISKLQRRPSWFSNISSKFSSGPGSSPPQANHTPPKQAELSIPRASPKNAVLQHASRYDGEGPYTPAPPKSSSQSGGIFHVLRRLSTSSGSAATNNIKGCHGLVERRVLNVDHNRERCQLTELNQSKLRRVSFCVDVEIAPMPKYATTPAAVKKAPVAAAAPKPKFTEKGEGAALKQLKEVPDEDSKDSDLDSANAATATAPPAPAAAATSAVAVTPAMDVKTADVKTSDAVAAVSTSPPASDGKPGDTTRKKEKKKKSEEERKTRKEKKRRLAEANGTIPMEIYLESDESDSNSPTGKASGATSNGTTTPTAPHSQMTPTTNPVRIYRRCCQLRETPILKKITEQLSNPIVFSAETGVVEKLDLTGYWMQVADLTTLGDFLAVVPIREVILENCGLDDEGLRVILSGLLAARKPQKRYIHLHHHHHHSYKSSDHIHGRTVPVTASEPNGLAQQGGFVERLVLKNNKIGVEGWKYICLFLYMCRSLKAIDLSSISFPRSAKKARPVDGASTSSKMQPFDVSQLLSKSLGSRLGADNLELLNVSDTGINSDQLSSLVDGLIKCGTKRLGLAHNDITDEGVNHVARYIASGKCEGLDLGGNDICDQLELIAEAATSTEALMALSLAECHLKPSSLSKLLPKLANLPKFRFLDLSHNHELFEAKPSALSILRHYLPMMESLKRLHLSDVSLTAEQAIAIAEIIPEVKELAFISLSKNPELIKLSDAHTEVSQEQACALYASLLAAARMSSSLVDLEIEPPTAESTEIVRAMAKQVLAYCLRNVDRVTLGNANAIIDGDALAAPKPGADGTSPAKPTLSHEEEIEYPVVIQHLVGHNALMLDEPDDVEAATDDDYVIGGTGVAQALEACLKNRGSDSARPSGEFSRESDGTITPTTAAKLPSNAKAKDMSKHLLASARKIRLRLQPTLQRARSNSGQDTQAYYRLLFLDNTLDGIIKRFEKEFPETRVSTDSGVSVSQLSSANAQRPHAASLDSNTCEPDVSAAILSDGEDEMDSAVPNMQRSNSVVSLSSNLNNEEGRVFRAGHNFRRGWLRHHSMVEALEDIEADPAHAPMLNDLILDIKDETLNKKLAEKGIGRLFREDRELIFKTIEASDPEHWQRFIESQEKTKANVEIERAENGQADVAPVLLPAATVSGGRIKLEGVVPEDAIDDDAISEDI